MSALAQAPDVREDLVEAVIRSECFNAFPLTQRGYRTVLRKFLSHVDKLSGFTAADLKDYFGSEIGAGQTRAYCRWQYTVLKALFRHLGEQIPVERRIIPPPRPVDVNAPALTPEEMQQMAEAAHRELIPPADVALLACASIWGFRRVELATLEIRAGTVSVAAAKTGVQRLHTIPEQLWPALEGYERLSVTEVGLRFIEIRRAAGVRAQKMMGWHAIRRAVATGLWEAGLDGPSIEAYMGWSPNTQRSSTRYFKPRPGEVDKRVYALHPYLPLW
ncbi:MAG: tyrosine-type recombinase/integrase [Candidatus Dormibacteria bacterium]